MTSLAYIFTMEKTLVNIIFGRIFLFVNQLSNFLAPFKTHYAGGVSEQGDMQKGSFRKMVQGE